MEKELFSNPVMWIPSDEKIYGSYNYENPDPEKFLDPVRSTLVGCGFNQIYANSLRPYDPQL